MHFARSSSLVYRIQNLRMERDTVPACSHSMYVLDAKPAGIFTTIHRVGDVEARWRFGTWLQGRCMHAPPASPSSAAPSSHLPAPRPTTVPLPTRCLRAICLLACFTAFCTLSPPHKSSCSLRKSYSPQKCTRHQVFDSTKCMLSVVLLHCTLCFEHWTFILLPCTVYIA